MSATHEEIYASIGYLLYSIAASDKHVAPAEAEQLKREVRQQWLPLEDSRDDLGVDAAHYVGFGFDHAVSEGMPAEAAFSRFKEQFMAAPGSYDDGVRRLIRSSSAAIAGATAGRNKSELVQLARVEELLARH
ncbi:MAG TPA: hypothetical protein PKY96_16975 [Flavobacteriales bacterium]|nr:hypothetical protein [Flavobacteriales bacterium]